MFGMRFLILCFAMTLTTLGCKESKNYDYSNPFVSRDKLEAEVDCLKADKANKTCRENYERLKRIYLQKQCFGQRKDVGFHFVYKRKTAGKKLKKVIYQLGEQFLVDEKPFLTPDSFEQLYFNVCHSNPKSFALFISLKPEDSKRISDLTARRDTPKRIALVVGDSAKAVPLLAGPISGGQFELCLPNIPMDSFKDEYMPWFCERYESEKLPPELNI